MTPYTTLKQRVLPVYCPIELKDSLGSLQFNYGGYALLPQQATQFTDFGSMEG